MPAVDTYFFSNRIFDPTLSGTTTRQVLFTQDAAGTASASKYWNINGAGTWNLAGDWNTSGVPNSPGVRAILGTISTAATTVTLDTNATVSSLTFQNSNQYTITGSNMLTVGGTLSTYGQLADIQGSHEIDTPITLAENLRTTVLAGSSTLTLTGVVGGAGMGITLFGSGTLNLTGANTFNAPIVMNGGMGGSQTGLGTLQIGSVANGGVACPLGMSSNAPSNLVLNGTLSYTGPTASTDRGFTTNGPVSINSGANNLTMSGQIVANLVSTLTKKGTGTLTLSYAGADTISRSDVTAENGTLAFAGGAASVYTVQENINTQHNLYIGDTSTPTNYGTTTAQVAISSGNVVVAQVYVGHAMSGPQTGLTMTGGTLTTNQFYGGDNENSTFSGTQVINLSGTALVFAKDYTEIGSSSGADTNLNMTGNAVFDSTNRINIGVLGNANVLLDGNSVLRCDAAGQFFDIAPNVGTANVTVQGNAQLITASGNVVDIGTGNNTSTGFTGGAQGIFTLQGNGLVAAGQLFVGRWNYGAGAVYQSSGSMTSSGGNGPWVIGGTDGNTNPYGYYAMSGGLFNSGLSNLYISNSGVGEWDQNGGAATAYQNVYVAGSGSGVGVMNVSGSGVFTVAGATAYTQGLFVGNSGSGVLNIGTGGTVNTGLGDVWLTNSGVVTPVASGIANLGTTAQPGGLLQTAGVWSGGNGNTSIFNFHGGTLQATASSGTFFGNLTHAYVYSEGAVINAAGNFITINQPLEAPTGLGVASIAVATNGGGIGYIGTPVVQISGGHGTGATAVATVIGQTVTGITVTNPGTGYLPGDSLNVQLLGVGALIQATAGPVTFNSGDTSGGLTIEGGGVVTLAAVNTYTGPTTITGTTLALASTGSIASSPLITLGSGATLDLTAMSSPYNFGGQTLAGNGTVNIGAGKTVTFAGGTFAPGGSIGTLAITGNLDLTGSVAAFELGTPGSSHASPGISDMAAINGNLTLGGTLNLIDNANNNGQGSAGLGSYQLFTYTGTESGSFASITGWNGGGTAHLVVSNDPIAKAVFLDLSLFANGSTAAPLNLGNVHPDSTSAGPLSVTNTTTGASVEGLGASFGSVPAGLFVNGSIANLPGGATDNVSMTVGVNDPTPGPRTFNGLTVNYVSVSAAGTTPRGSSAVPVNATVYDYAAASPLPAAVSLANVHVGDTFVPVSVSVQNTTPDSGGYSEWLGGSGLPLPILPGQSGSVSIGISGSTGSPGSVSVSVPVAFTSVAVPGSGLSNTPLGSQNVTASGGVYAYASPNLVTTSVSLGNVHVGDAFLAQPVTVQNLTPDSGGYSESLAAASCCGNVTVGPGGSGNVFVSVNDTSTPGAVNVSIPVVFTSIHVDGSGLSDTPLGSQNVTATGGIYAYATPNTLPAVVSVGNAHVGGTLQYTARRGSELDRG